MSKYHEEKELENILRQLWETAYMQAVNDERKNNFEVELMSVDQAHKQITNLLNQSEPYVYVEDKND